MGLNFWLSSYLNFLGWALGAKMVYVESSLNYALVITFLADFFFLSLWFCPPGSRISPWLTDFKSPTSHVEIAPSARTMGQPPQTQSSVMIHFFPF